MNNNIPEEILVKCKNLSTHYTYLKNKNKQIEKEMESIKNYLEHILLKYNTNSIETSTFKINRKIIKQQRISKDDLPETIFKTYSKPIIFSSMYIQSNL